MEEDGGWLAIALCCELIREEPGNQSVTASHYSVVNVKTSQNNSLLIVIPARGGSKRLPGKHARPLRGKTLLERTADTVREADLDAPCLLTTDDPDLVEAGRRLGWTVPFLRPAQLATDTASSIDTVLHAVDWYASEHGGPPDHVMLLQTTSPLREASVLRDGFNLLKQNPDLNAVISISQVQASPSHVYTNSLEGFLQPISTKQEVDPVFVPNGALYVIRTSVLYAQRTFVPTGTRGMLMSDTQSIDIDTQQDWDLAEALIDYFHEQAAEKR